MKITAIQLNAGFCDVSENLKRAEMLISQAKSEGSRLAVLPEFFNSAMGFDKRMLCAASHGVSTHEWMVSTASKYDIILGGAYISLCGDDACNLFELVFPNGEVFSHRKDLPTQYENCYYTNGDINHVLETPIGNIGVALCWEMIRYNAVRRMSGKVDLILAGSCRWDIPMDALPERNELRKYNQRLALEAPVMYIIMCGTVMLLVGIYVLLNLIRKNN